MSKLFADMLSRLMKEARLTRKQLAKQLSIPVNTLDNYRYSPYQLPSRELLNQLITIFKPYLTPQTAQDWADTINYTLSSTELRKTFPPPTMETAPLPNRELTVTRLPSLTEKFFGITAAKDRLLDRLASLNDHWLVSIDGIGGIGKTALATSIVHRLMHTNYFYDMVWLSAKQEEFVSHQGVRPIEASLKEANFIDSLLEQLAPDLPLARSPHEKKALLANWLKNQRYLVVIDNLETLADTEELLAPVRQLANPSKFLFTTRHSLSDHADVFSFTVPTLNQDDAFEMLWYAGDTQNIRALREAETAQLKEIYTVVGGNPLALKLVIGQIRHSASLGRVLTQLQEAKGKKAKDLYNYIYWQSWHALTDEARRVLRVMGILQTGTAEDIIDSDFHPTPLTDLALQTALESLLRFSLVEKGGGLDEATYHIHRLTETFLMTNLFQWENLYGD